MLYKDQEHIKFAYERIEEQNNCSRGKKHTVQRNERNFAQPAQAYISEGRGLESKIEQNMELQFRKQGSFNRKLGENITEHICKHTEAAQDYKLHQAGKLALLHNILDGEAKRFYRGKVKNRCGTLGQDIKTMKDD